MHAESKHRILSLPYPEEPILAWLQRPTVLQGSWKREMSWKVQCVVKTDEWHAEYWEMYMQIDALICMGCPGTYGTAGQPSHKLWPKDYCHTPFSWAAGRS